MKPEHPNLFGQAGRHASEDGIPAAVRGLYERIDIPDGLPAWESMQQKLRRAERRARRMRTLRVGLSIAGISVLLATFMSAASPTYAFDRLYRVLKETSDGFVHLVYGPSEERPTSGAKTAPPPDYAGGAEAGTPRSPDESPPQADAVLEPREVSSREARELLAFPLREPSVLPEAYDVSKIRVYAGLDGAYRQALTEFTDGGDRYFYLSQQQLSEDGSGWTSSINEAAGVLKSLNVNGTAGTLVLYTGGGARLEWLSGDVLIEIYGGKLTETEIMQVAEGLGAKN